MVAIGLFAFCACLAEQGVLWCSFVVRFDPQVTFHTLYTLAFVLRGVGNNWSQHRDMHMSLERPIDYSELRVAATVEGAVVLRGSH